MSNDLAASPAMLASMGAWRGHPWPQHKPAMPPIYSRRASHHVFPSRTERWHGSLCGVTLEVAMPAYDYVTVNVFTDQRFGGNPLAVFPDASGLTDAQMQDIATDFNLSETTFVLPPADPRHHARVRIFTPKTEM